MTYHIYYRSIASLRMRLAEVQDELINERAAFSAVLAKQQQHHKHSKQSQHTRKRSSRHAHSSTHDRNKRHNNSTNHSDNSNCGSDSSSSDEQHEHDNELFVLDDATDATNDSKLRESALSCSSSTSSMISLQGNKAKHLHAYLSAKAKHVLQLRRESQAWQHRCIAACSKWSQLAKQNAELQAKIQDQSAALSLRDESLATLQQLLHSKDAQLTTLHTRIADLATTTANAVDSTNASTATASAKRKQVCIYYTLHYYMYILF
jgi:hypothetical protein